MDGSDALPKRPPTAQEFVLAELRAALVAGDLAPGEQIRQDALAERFGTSRVPLREALKILEGEGLVTYQPHRGYFVAVLSRQDLAEVYRLRALLEDELVAVALPTLSPADMLVMEQALEDGVAAAQAGDAVAMMLANRRFHFVLIEQAQRPRFTRLLRTLWDVTDGYRQLAFIEPANRDAVEREHRAILQAVRERDVPRTIALLRTHRDDAQRRIARAVSTD